MVKRTAIGMMNSLFERALFGLGHEGPEEEGVCEITDLLSHQHCLNSLLRPAEQNKNREER
jgi:hypothetical protein